MKKHSTLEFDQNIVRCTLLQHHIFIDFGLCFLKELEGFKRRSGITLFMPNDISFVQLPQSVNTPSL
jgi:hypothetical protein